MSIRYRQASREELNLAVEWAAAEGWNPGLHDADIFWDTNPDGFVCAEREGEVIATGSIVHYGREFGFMGFFIVRPDLRGQGIGRDFWHWRRDLLRKRLEENAPIGMDGVFDMQPFYAKGGFEFTHRNLRMEGIATEGIQDSQLVELRDLPFSQVEKYDRKHFGYRRSAFMEAWVTADNSLSLGLLNNDEIVGMGTIRKCRKGYKIGPLFADHEKAAEAVFSALSNHVSGQAIYLDIPENNPNALALAARHKLKEVFGCARMYHGSIPALPWNQIFGISTFELG